MWPTTIIILLTIKERVRVRMCLSHKLYIDSDQFNPLVCKDKQLRKIDYLGTLLLYVVCYIATAKVLVKISSKYLNYS